MYWVHILYPHPIHRHHQSLTTLLSSPVALTLAWRARRPEADQTMIQDARKELAERLLSAQRRIRAYELAAADCGIQPPRPGGTATDKPQQRRPRKLPQSIKEKKQIEDAVRKLEARLNALRDEREGISRQLAAVRQREKDMLRVR